MAFKFIALAAFVAVANAGLLPAAPVAVATPIAKTVITKVADAEYDPHPQYSYGYDVADSITGDFKSQSETRDGDVVQGQYSLLEADGTRRVVDYAADPLNGFNAIVRKEPATLAVKAAAPVAVAAPIVKAALPVAAPLAVKTALPVAAPAPLAYAAPAYTRFASPLAYSSPAFAPAAYSAGPAFAYGAGPAFVPAAYSAGPAFAYGAYGAPAFAKTFY